MNLWDRLFGRSKNRKLQEEKKKLEEQRIREELEKREEALIKEEQRFQNEVRLWKEIQLKEERKRESEIIKEEQKKREEERIKEEERLENEVRLRKERQLEEQRKQEALRKRKERKKQENSRKQDVSDDSDNLIEQIGYDNYKMILEVKAKSDRILKEFRESTAEIVKKANEKNLRFVEESNDKKAVDTEIIINSNKNEINDRTEVRRYSDVGWQNDIQIEKSDKNFKKVKSIHSNNYMFDDYLEDMFSILYDNDENKIDSAQIEYEKYLDFEYSENNFIKIDSSNIQNKCDMDNFHEEVPNGYYEEMFEILFNNDEDEIYREQIEYEQYLDIVYEDRKWLEEYERASKENDEQLELSEEEYEVDEIIDLDVEDYYGYYFDDDYDNSVPDLKYIYKEYIKDSEIYDYLEDTSDDFMLPIDMYLEMCRIFKLDSSSFTIPEIVEGTSFYGKKSDCARITDISLVRMDPKFFESFTMYVGAAEAIYNSIIEERIAREFEEENCY